MGRPKTPEPSQEEVLYLRESVLNTLQEKGIIDNLDQRDLKKFKTDDHYVKRFLLNHDNEHKKAHEMAIDTLKWRKSYGANDLTLEDCDLKFLEKGTLCLYNQDRDGATLLIFTLRNHTKGNDMDKMKKSLVYLIERFVREEKSEKMTVVYDVQDAGIKNMDMEFIQYMINVFKLYYPEILNYILVFEMSWILNAVWKIIKSWLPPKALDLIKFVDRKTIGTYVSPDQTLKTWGGDHTFDFVFVPEKTEALTTSEEVSSLTPVVVNGDIENKKVHFAESKATSQMLKVKIPTKASSSLSGSVNLDVEPSDELMFKSNKVGSTTSLHLTNRSPSPIAFKIKTTSPEKYRVKPSIGSLPSEGQIEVIVTQMDQQPPSSLVRDKFLVMAIPVLEDVPLAGLDQLFKATSKDDTIELRLRVGITSPDPVTESPFANHVQATPSTTTMSPLLMNKLEQLLTKQSSLEEQFISSRRMIYLTLVIMIAILCFLVFTTVSLTSNIVSHNQAIINAAELTAQCPNAINTEL